MSSARVWAHAPPPHHTRAVCALGGDLSGCLACVSPTGAVPSCFEHAPSDLRPTQPTHPPLAAACPHQGMRFLHLHGIVHRDLKSLNVLLDAAWTAKISDFGLAKVNSTVAASTGGGGYHSKVRPDRFFFACPPPVGETKKRIEMKCLPDRRAPHPTPTPTATARPCRMLARWLFEFFARYYNLLKWTGSFFLLALSWWLASAKVGSDFWMAPEVHCNRRATKASDVFSCHVVMWEVGVRPYFWCYYAKTKRT